jgi:hypothetical protein
VMRAAGDDPDGVRLRGLIVVLWRTGRRISEALASTESDLDAGRGTALGARRNAHATAPSGRSRQGAPPVGPASAAPSACREDVARGGPAARHPAPAGTPISPSPPSICAASTTPKSCTPSTNDLHPRSLPTTDCNCTAPTLRAGRGLDPPHRRQASVSAASSGVMKTQVRGCSIRRKQNPRSHVTGGQERPCFVDPAAQQS